MNVIMIIVQNNLKRDLDILQLINNFSKHNTKNYIRNKKEMQFIGQRITKQ